MKETNYYNQKGILATPDHYVNIALSLNKDTHSGLVVDIGGRKIIKAGTIYPANDNTAQGLIFTDIDVTDGTQEAALLIHGFVKLGSLPTMPSAQAKAGMPLIKFFPFLPMEVTITTLDDAGIPVGATPANSYMATVQLVGAIFRPEATDKANWDITGETATAVSITEITLDTENPSIAYIQLTPTTAAVAGTISAKPFGNGVSTGQNVTDAVVIATVQ